ncbi:MAG TPA: hypothetical protein VLL97_07405 [Acidobacteriota bacterium]|nr:hypothetical protein [Acidobacteriota bacterium]
MNSPCNAEMGNIMKPYTEYAFETAIEHHLITAGGYEKGDREAFDPVRTLFPADVITFIRATQPEQEGLPDYEEEILRTMARRGCQPNIGFFTLHRIGGKAKAMVVTGSRLHAVKYKQAFDRYIAEKGNTEIKTLVAFSCTVIDPDVPGVERRRKCRAVAEIFSYWPSEGLLTGGQRDVSEGI